MCVRDRDRSPPPPRNVDDVIWAMSKGGCACECPRVRGVFQFSGGRMTVTRTMFKGCVCVLVNVFTPPPPLRKSCRPIRTCNMPSRSVEIKQPPQRRPKLAIHCWVPLSLYCRVSPPPQPGLAVSTSGLPYPLPGPATTTAGSRRLYCWVPPSLLLVCSRLTPRLIRLLTWRTQSLTP